MYASITRPHLENAVQVWNPRLLGDLKSLEKVQRRATKILTMFSKPSYDQRLAELGLTRLKDRRDRGDLIQMFKIMKGLEVVKWEKDLNIKERTIRHNLSYSRESFKSRAKNDFASFAEERLKWPFFFVNKVASSKNDLPPNMINSSSLNSFKATLDKFTKNGYLSM